MSTYCDVGTKQQAPDSTCLIAAKLIANICVRFPRLYYHSHTNIQTLQGGWAGWNQEPTGTLGNIHIYWCLSGYMEFKCTDLWCYALTFHSRNPKIILPVTEIRRSFCVDKCVSSLYAPFLYRLIYWSKLPPSFFRNLYSWDIIKFFNFFTHSSENRHYSPTCADGTSTWCSVTPTFRTCQLR